MFMTDNFVETNFYCRHCKAGAGIVKKELLIALQRLRTAWGKPMYVNCGYRCPEHNKAVGGAKFSAHLTGMAADIDDTDGALKAFCTPERLEEAGLWAEEYAKTPTWIHLQTRPAKDRIFKV